MIERITRNPALADALRACKRHFVYAGVFSALLNLLYIAPTLYMLQIYDRIVPSRSVLTLWFVTIVLVVATAVLALLDLTRSRLLVRASIRLDRELSPLLMAATLDNRGPPRDGILRDFDAFRQAMTGPAILAAFDLPWTPIYILLAMFIHPLIGLVGLIGVAVVIAIAWMNEKSTHGPLDDARKSANAAYQLQSETVMYAGVIRALGMRGAMIGRNRRQRDEMLGMQAWASFHAGRYVSASKFARLILQSAGMGLGGLLAIENQISAGAIFASSFLIGRALSPIDQIVAAWQSATQARQALNAIEDALPTQAAQGERTALGGIEGRLSAEGISVLRGQGERAILSQVSLSVNPGESLLVFGHSGAGKSTLLRILGNAEFPHQGQVRFDGAAADQWDGDVLAANLGYLPQDVALLAGSIRDNISRFQDPERTSDEDIDAKVVEAAKQAGAHDMIVALSGGYDYRIGQFGRGLSAGQAQRVALARALYGDPKVLVLDEPNAQLDPEGEARLLQALVSAKARGAAVVVAAHRMGIVKAVDRILVLKDGKVEMLGPRDEVLKRLMGPVQRPVAGPVGAVN